MQLSDYFVFSGLGLLSFGLAIELYRTNFKQKAKVANTVLMVSLGLGTALVIIGFVVF